MAAKKSNTAATKVEPVNTGTTEAVKPEEKKFPLENLAKHSKQLFGVSSCTFAGATAGLTGSYTVEEMNNIIKEWCRKEIK